MAKTPKSGSSNRARQRSRQQPAGRPGSSPANPQGQRDEGRAEQVRTAEPQAEPAPADDTPALADDTGSLTTAGQPDTDADLKPEDADSKPEDADLKPEDADLKPEDADLKPEDADLKPEDAGAERPQSTGVASAAGGGKAGTPGKKPPAQRGPRPRSADKARAASKPRAGRPGGKPVAGKPVKSSSARRKAEQRRRQRTLLYSLLTVGVVAVLVAVIIIDRGSDTPEANDEDFRQNQASLAPARQAAGCGEVQEHPLAGRDHISPADQPSNWNSNPPSSGDHLEVWLQPGFYEEPQDERMAVHSLEHGYVLVQYKNISEDQLAQLRDLQAGHEGEKLVVQPYDGLEADGVALSAWQHTQTCEQVNPEVINGFVDAFMLPGGSQSVAPEPLAG